MFETKGRQFYRQREKNKTVKFDDRYYLFLWFKVGFDPQFYDRREVYEHGNESECITQYLNVFKVVQIIDHLSSFSLWNRTTKPAPHLDGWVSFGTFIAISVGNPVIAGLPIKLLAIQTNWEQRNDLSPKWWCW